MMLEPEFAGALAEGGKVGFAEHDCNIMNCTVSIVQYL
jgi:hypothetical protein